MAERELDVLVVGAGVVGAGTALDAVTRGLSTGLVEARDWASGTSSRSSKLIHGGLRYLEMLDFALVREALKERGLLLERLAPHLVKPVPFLYPLAAQGLGAALRRIGRRAVRRDVGVVGRTAGACPPTGISRAAHALRVAPCLQEGRAGRRAAVLRRADGRRPLSWRPWCARPRATGRRSPAAHASSASSVRASGSSAPGCRTWRPAGSTRSGPSRSSTPRACGRTTPRP